ncbi:MAG: hypothetical protein ACLRSD_09785 [Oscillibacter sp.]
MKVIELLKSKEWSGKVIDCVLRFALCSRLRLRRCSAATRRSRSA